MRAALFGLMLSGLAAAPAAADEAASEAVFAADHLGAVEAPETLTYEFAATGASLKRPDSDSVTLEVTGLRPDGRKDTLLTLFSGERRQRFPGPQEGALGNPLIVLFLKRDAEAMGFLTGGNPDYFRNRIRAAFRGPARIEPARVPYQGREVEASRVSFSPYLDDPHAREMGHLRRKVYEIVLSDAVPGGLYRFRAYTPATDGGAPLIDETLTFKGAAS